MTDLKVLCAKDDSYGVWTSPGTPERYVFRFNELLNMNAVSYHKDLIVVNPFNTAKPDEKITAAKKEFERQLRSFRKAYMFPQSLNSKISIKYTGKVDKDNKRSSRQRDDMCMAALLGIYWAQQYANGLIVARGFQEKFRTAHKAAHLAPVTDHKRAAGIDDDEPMSALYQFAKRARREIMSQT